MTGIKTTQAHILTSALCTASVRFSTSPHFFLNLQRHPSDQQTQDLVRDKAAGRGLLYPDTFSEERLLFLPPAASVLLVILSRNHNVSV